jgi:hypothetical protein
LFEEPYLLLFEGLLLALALEALWYTDARFRTRRALSADRELEGRHATVTYRRARRRVRPVCFM